MSLEKIVHGLASSDNSVRYECLVAVRTKFIKRKDGVELLRQHSGVSSLINILKTCRKEKTLDITLSILGNCCLEEKTRTQILEIGGITIVADVLLQAKPVSICNRSCRTLANLAMDAHCCESIHKLNTIVPHVVKRMANIDDKECQQTYLRALRLFSDTPEHRATVIANHGLTAVCATLKESSSEKVILAALKTLTTLTTEMPEDCIQQILSTDILQRLSQLCSEPSAFRAPSLALILVFSQRTELRPALGSTGVIQPLLAFVLAGKDDSVPIVNALCHFCQEAVNRVRIRETGTLKQMLQWLRLDMYSRIHNRLISALVCFLYDEPSMDLLLANGLVAILVQHLHRCMTRTATVAAHKTAVMHTIGTDSCDVLVEEVNDVTVPKHGEELADIESTAEMRQGTHVADVMQHGNPVDEVSNADGQRAAAEEAVSRDSHNEDSLSDLVTVEQHQDLKTGDAQSSHHEEDESCSKWNLSDTETIGNESSHDVSISNITIDETEKSTSSKTVSHQSQDTLQTSKQETTDDLPLDAVKPVPDTSVRYSIDSPTYKTLSDVSFADGYSGPRNIMQSAEYYGRASPHGLYGYQSPPRYSPLSTLSYPSPEWSPESSPLRSVSPVMFEFSPCLPSTSGGGTSPMNGASSHWNYTEPTFNQDSEPAKWSPVQSFSEDVGEEECISVELAAETSNAMATLQHFVQESADSCQVLVDAEAEPTDCDHTIVVEQQVEDGDDDGVDKAATVEVSLDEPADNSLTAVLCGANSCKRGLKLTGRRKRSLSVETMSKIRKIVAASPSHSNVDVSELMCSPASSSMDSCKHYNRHHDPTKMTEHNILVLLSRISYMTDPSKYLVSEATLRGLLSYVATASRPLSRAARILRRLTRNTHCFESIILTMMPMLIETLLSTDYISPPSSIHSAIHSTVLTDNQHDCDSKLDEYSNDQSVNGSTAVDEESSTRRNDTFELKRCLLTNLSLVSESRYGRGVISHILLTGNRSNKLTCAMSLPFLCRSCELRRKMLLDFSGLELLLKSFSITTDPAFPLAVRSLSTLFTSPSIKFIERVNECQQPVPDTDTTQPSTSVTFVMDDGSRMTAFRTLLVQQSSVFAAMLDGHYCESEQAEVRISEVSSPAFRVLVDFIQSGHFCPTMPCQSLELHIDVLALANQYLLSDLQQSVSRLLCEEYLTEDTVCLLLEFAQLHNSVWLAQKCAQFVLGRSMYPTLRVDIARQLMDSEQKCDTLSTIKHLLVSSIM